MVIIFIFFVDFLSFSDIFDEYSFLRYYELEFSVVSKEILVNRSRIMNNISYVFLEYVFYYLFV